MVMDYLTNRLGSEPILFLNVKLTVTVTMTGTETVRVNGPLTQTQNISFVLISPQPIDVMLKLWSKHAQTEIPTRNVNGPLVLGLIPVSRLNLTIQRFTRSPCPWRLPNKDKMSLRGKSPRNICALRGLINLVWEAWWWWVVETDIVQ